MAMITIISRETIKPSSPTPSDQTSYNLSELDQLFHHIYMPITLLYPHDANSNLTALHKATLLKQSLSQSLTKYYPFAGRLATPVKPSYVDCNDEGVVFVEAKSDSELTAYLEQHLSKDDETVAQLFADKLIGPNSSGSTNVVGVQVNHFSCGGVALAISMSHTVGDASTLARFVYYWASVARFGSTDHEEILPINPHFIRSPRTNSLLPDPQVTNPGQTSWVTRKFVFSNSKLNDLKNKVIESATTESDQTTNKPTRFEVLTSLLYKTAVEAATKRSGCFQPSCLVTPVDIRSKFVEKLPLTTVGNLVAGMMVPTINPSETSLSILVSKLKKEKLQLEGIESVQHAAQNMISLFVKLGTVAKRAYTCTSICGFPFEKVDFGWGKPLCAAHPVLKAASSTGFVLTDTPDGDGIQVIVILDEEEMEIFSNDKELLSFGEVNQK